MECVSNVLNKESATQLKRVGASYFITCQTRTDLATHVKEENDKSLTPQ